ncbi:OmpH family outer membrane protein [Bernardetia sp. ABR2-2B]|uniref:OmpH family outer membrane protein n=1 Tax=Bernardetia sp. ABR2-2B TaxID=3127472 RepID=UPI0030D4A308
MKKIFLLFTLFVFVVSAQAQDVKIGYTSISSVFPHFPMYKKAQDSIRKTQNSFYTQLQNDENELNEKYEKLLADSKTGDFPQVVLQNRAKALETAKQQLLQNEEAYNKTLQNLQMSLIQPIQIKFQEAVAAVGKENGYTFVLSSQDGMGQDNFLYSNGKIDITLMVLKKLGVNMTVEELAAANAKLQAEAEAAAKAQGAQN